jgi:hypothetical protein
LKREELGVNASGHRYAAVTSFVLFFQGLVFSGLALYYFLGYLEAAGFIRGLPMLMSGFFSASAILSFWFSITLWRGSYRRRALGVWSGLQILHGVAYILYFLIILSRGYFDQISLSLILTLILPAGVALIYLIRTTPHGLIRWVKEEVDGLLLRNVEEDDLLVSEEQGWIMRNWWWLVIIITLILLYLGSTGFVLLFL